MVECEGSLLCVVERKDVSWALFAGVKAAETSCHRVTLIRRPFLKLLFSQTKPVKACTPLTAIMITRTLVLRTRKSRAMQLRSQTLERHSRKVPTMADGRKEDPELPVNGTIAIKI